MKAFSFLTVKGYFAGVDLDGVVDEGGDGGGVVFGDGLLELVRSCCPDVISTDRSMDLSRAVEAD